MKNDGSRDVIFIFNNDITFIIWNIIDNRLQILNLIIFKYLEVSQRMKLSLNVHLYTDGDVTDTSTYE